MEILKKKIEKGIDGKGFCTVFHSDVEKIYGRKIQLENSIKKAVDSYARAHGWRAIIGGAGLRVTFRKAA